MDLETAARLLSTPDRLSIVGATTPLPAGSPQSKPRVLRAKYVNHTGLADLTEIRGFLGLFTYKLVVVLDSFSRLPLSFEVIFLDPERRMPVHVLEAWNITPTNPY